ncbi:MAG: hypothetical protein J6B98_01385 [Bacilli bacterium]|nr:hypothetical protein [Bacilli bacterium]
MILRKPYAFFIKHFRLIHVILSVLMIYCLYNSKRLLDFFNGYISTNINLKGQELVSIYTPWLYQITPFLIMIVIGIILVVMILKKKPMMLYIINVASYIFTTIVIQVSKGTLTTLQDSLMDVRSVRLIRDIIMLSFMFQIVGTIVVVVRSVGFDVKKFDFKQDLKELEFNEEDREEFELELKFDKNKTRTTIRRNIRFIKYAYKENKMLAHIVIGVVSILIVGSVGIYYIKMDKPVGENVYIANNGITLKITDSYITDTDYKGNIIDKESLFIILKVNIKTNIATETLDVATSKIQVGNYSYIPIYDYKEAFLDFGDVYLGGKLSTEYENRILVYKIPKQLKEEKIEFQLINKATLDRKIVKLNIEDLTVNKKEVKLGINDELDFSDSILYGYKIKINKFDIQRKYKLEYNFCTDKCVTSYQYLVPSINSSVDKSILRIEGTLIKEETVSNINDLYDVIGTFGVINYSIGGVNKTNTIPLKEIVSTKKKEENVFYIEIPRELEIADKISIKFIIKNKIYEYVLK